MGWNIGLGVLFIIGGLSGDFALKGTESSGWLAIVGAGLLYSASGSSHSSATTNCDARPQRIV